MSRAVFIVIAGFWLTMNVLLWQTEFGSRKSSAAIPVEIVWEKILTAADDSSLTVFHEGKLVGAFHMQTQVGEEWSKVSDDNIPSGRPQKGRGYSLRLDGSAILPQWTNRVRFEWGFEAEQKPRLAGCEPEGRDASADVGDSFDRGGADDSFEDTGRPGAD